MTDFADLRMTLEDCRHRLAFLQDAFSQNTPDSIQSSFGFSIDGQAGLYAILGDISGQIAAADAMAEEIIRPDDPKTPAVRLHLAGFPLAQVCEILGCSPEDFQGQMYRYRMATKEVQS